MGSAVRRELLAQKVPQEREVEERVAPGDAIFFRPGVETMGLEPTTPCLQSRCSSQLSYVPEGRFSVVP